MSVDIVHKCTFNLHVVFLYILYNSDGLCVFAATGTAVVTSSCDTAPESPDSQVGRGMCE